MQGNNPTSPPLLSVAACLVALTLAACNPQGPTLDTAHGSHRALRAGGITSESMITRDDPRLIAAADKHGIPHRFAFALVTAESRGNCRARSSSNARGVTQVLPATARSVGVYGNLFDCSVGLDAGFAYLRRVTAVHGFTCKGFTLYNYGEAATVGCQAYGRHIMSLANRY